MLFVVLLRVYINSGKAEKCANPRWELEANPMLCQLSYAVKSVRVSSIYIGSGMGWHFKGSIPAMGILFGLPGLAINLE